MAPRAHERPVADCLPSSRNGQPKVERGLVARVVVAREPPRGDLRLADSDRASLRGLERRQPAVPAADRGTAISHPDRGEAPFAQDVARPHDELMRALREAGSNAVDAHRSGSQDEVEVQRVHSAPGNQAYPRVAGEDARGRLVADADRVVTDVIARVAGVGEVRVAHPGRSATGRVGSLGGAGEEAGDDGGSGNARDGEDAGASRSSTGAGQSGSLLSGEGRMAGLAPACHRPVARAKSRGRRDRHPWRPRAADPWPSAEEVRRVFPRRW
jgi:hypothetical protein